ncbi:hypothetical protein [Aquimarina sp. SS2-1]|uniref:hypothetical protein n=1 Tax=Aquimarina besae TaxID=3342247 RepID=UPI00366F6326
MKIIKIRCARCQETLTNAIRRFVLDLTHFDVGEEIVEKGHYCDGHEDISIAHNDRILVNNKDSKLLNHKLLKNYMGCCGYYDTNSLNQICPNCQKGIATIVTECYTYHYLAIAKDKIIIEEVSE